MAFMGADMHFSWVVYVTVYGVAGGGHYGGATRVNCKKQKKKKENLHINLGLIILYHLSDRKFTLYDS